MNACWSCRGRAGRAGERERQRGEVGERVNSVLGGTDRHRTSRHATPPGQGAPCAGCPRDEPARPGQPGQAGDRGAAARVAPAVAELADRPADVGGVAAQATVGVDRAREPDLGQDRDVVGRVPVGVATSPGRCPRSRRSRAPRRPWPAVQHVAHEPAGVVAVLVLGDGAQRPVAPRRRAISYADLHGRRGDQPDGVAGGDVLVEQALRARVDAQAEDLVVDVLRDRGDLGHRVAPS